LIPEAWGFNCVGFFLVSRGTVSEVVKNGAAKNERSVLMLWTLVFILLVLWLLGMVTSYTAGGLIHILLVVALVVIVVRLLQGRRPLA
jgi:hypothetical protein